MQTCGCLFNSLNDLFQEGRKSLKNNKLYLIASSDCLIGSAERLIASSERLTVHSEKLKGYSKRLNVYSE